MHAVARARLVLARRPWIHWVATAVLATGAGLVMQARLTDVERARAAWGDTVAVYVASRSHEPGDPLTAHRVEMPKAIVPDSAITDSAVGTRVRQRVATGEIVTDVDVASRPGPASGAPVGTVVVAVAVAGGGAGYVPIGSHVQISADGVVLSLIHI